ncbi:hypothetical protein POM88_043167 [Heracleum sosnowskyi]|uniref:non-specific serine/threonine protein kinase n=1 Tax=Heracleum sosnowskyi TaxID=360622 RepID=A0AAD8H2V7_9APIA|nr:hypothetical protein POM88_043167 [Heracleum sosnowskyi]
MPQSSAVSSEYGWAVPPPPPPMGHSSDMSSSDYSGPRHPPMPPPHPALALGFNKSTFTYDELAAATSGFYHLFCSDFGLAKLSNENYTHVSTRIMGTFGYLAPEYASSGKLTEKSDVYSYRVMLLELARPILMRAVDGGDYNELVDPRLLDNYDADEMLRMVACAAACIRHSARRRPKMSQIVRAFEGDVSLEDLHEGFSELRSPGVFIYCLFMYQVYWWSYILTALQSFVLRTGGPLTGSSASCAEYDGSYSVDMKKFRKAGGSNEYSSGDYGH